MTNRELVRSIILKKIHERFGGIMPILSILGSIEMSVLPADHKLSDGVIVYGKQKFGFHIDFNSTGYVSGLYDGYSFSFDEPYKLGTFDWLNLLDKFAGKATAATVGLFAQFENSMAQAFREGCGKK